MVVVCPYCYYCCCCWCWCYFTITVVFPQTIEMDRKNFKSEHLRFAWELISEMKMLKIFNDTKSTFMFYLIYICILQMYLWENCFVYMCMYVCVYMYNVKVYEFYKYLLENLRNDKTWMVDGYYNIHTYTH